jgi:hypothetical protein
MKEIEINQALFYLDLFNPFCVLVKLFKFSAFKRTECECYG